MLEQSLHEQIEIAFNYRVPKPENAEQHYAKSESRI